jgi:hypothetical protein
VTGSTIPLWESFVAIKPPPELSSFFSACTGLSLSRCAAVQLRHHIRDYLIAKGLLILDTQEPRKNRIHAMVCRQMSHWVEMHRYYQDRYSDMPPRVSTAERLLSLFQEKRDLWLGEWAREFEQINLPTGSEGKRVNDLWWPVPIYHQAKSVTSVAQKTRDLVREVMKEGMGILADRPCSNCVRRKKACWLHIDDKLGKCLDCIRGVVGEIKVRVFLLKGCGR